MSRVTQDTAKPGSRFAEGAVTRSGRTFQYRPAPCTRATTRSYNPTGALLHTWFGLFPGRSPLLGESLVIFFSWRY